MKKLLMLLSFVFYFFNVNSQTLTGPSLTTSGSTITITASGETESGHFGGYPFFNPAGTTTSAPSSNFQGWVSLQVLSQTNLWNFVTKTPTQFTTKLINTNEVPITATFYFTTTIQNDISGAFTNNVLKTFTITINPTITLPTTTYYSSAISGVFYKNNCGDGYTSMDPHPYTLPANAISSIISQADANLKAQLAFNTNGQNAANENGVCSCSVAPNAPVFLSISGNGKGVLLVVAEYSEASSYKWYLNGVYLKTTTTSNTGIALACGLSGIIGVEAVNDCGISPRSTQSVVGCQLANE